MSVPKYTPTNLSCPPCTRLTVAIITSVNGGNVGAGGFVIATYEAETMKGCNVECPDD